MVDSNKNNTKGGAPGISLEQLSELIKPLTVDEVQLIHFYYLLLLWASFRVYQIDPMADGEGDEDGGIYDGVPKVILLTNGRKIYDYGYCLSTSTGEDYGSYCTGKLIEVAQEMIHILDKRGVKIVGFAGHDIPKRAAWIECLETGIEVSNFYPDEYDWYLRDKIRKIRQVNSRTGEPEPDRRPI